MFACSRPMARKKGNVLKRTALAGAVILGLSGLYKIGTYDPNTRGYEGQPFGDYEVNHETMWGVASRVSKKVPPGYKRDMGYIMTLIADSSGVDKKTWKIYPGQILRVPQPEKFGVASSDYSRKE